MDILTIVLLAAVALLGLVLVLSDPPWQRRGRDHAPATRSGAQPAGRDRAAGRAFAARAGAGALQGRGRAARPHREGDRPDRHRPARAAGPHRRGAEEDRRSLDPGRQPAGSAVQQAGARRLRRGPAERPGAKRPAAPGLRIPVHALFRGTGRLPAASAQPAGLDRHRRQVPARKLQRAARRGGGRHRRPAGRPAQLPAGHPQAHRRHPRQVHHARRDRRIGADVPAVGSRLCRTARQLHRPGRGILSCARLDRVAHHHDGDAQHRARRAEGRAHARAGGRDPEDGRAAARGRAAAGRPGREAEEPFRGRPRRTCATSTPRPTASPSAASASSTSISAKSRRRCRSLSPPI